MSSDSHATITYTSMSSYEVIVNGYFRMPMDPLDPYVQLIIEAPPSPDYIPRLEAPPLPDYIPRPEAPPSPDYIPGPEVPPSPDYILGPEAPSLPDYIPGLKYPQYLPLADDDDTDDEDEEESSDSEEEHLALTVFALALHSSIPASEDSDEIEPFKEGETVATPPPFGYRVAARIFVQPHILMPFRSESEVKRLLAIPTSPLSPVSPTLYPLQPFLMPLPIFTPLPPPPNILPRTRASMALIRSASPSTFILASRSRKSPIGTPLLLPIPIPTSSFPLPLSLPSTSSSESVPEVDMPLWKRARFTTPTGGYEVGESFVASTARHIRLALTIADSRRAEDRLIGRLRRERGDTFATCLTLMRRRLLTPVIIVLGSWTTASHERFIPKMAPKRARTTRANPDPTRTTTVTKPMTQESINNLIAQRVAEALAEYKTQRSVVNRDTSNTTGTGPRRVRPTRECTYKDYLNCAPLKFNGTEGVIGLTRWFERTESVSSISNCTAENQVKGTDITSYTLRFQKLTLLCMRMFPEESDEIERVAQAYAARSGEKPYRETKPLCLKCNFYHDGPCRPKCTNFKRTGHIARDCRSRADNTDNNNNNNNNNNQRATAAYQGFPTCFECGAQGHFKNNCPRLGNRNQGNQNPARNGNVVARAYGLGTAGGNPNANVMMGTFLLNNHCASILFDTGADKSFVSTSFSSLININPSTLDYSYDVE
nr:hypothetical protein [Tanacetum cinerariifolium]